MSSELQHFSAFFYILCFEIIITNSRTSTLWRLSEDKTKIIEASPVPEPKAESEMFDIITSTERNGQDWIKQSLEFYCSNCHNQDDAKTNLTNGEGKGFEEELDCGKSVNFTYYDNLVGVYNRKRHPKIPEPRAAYNFMKKGKCHKNWLAEFDIDALERRLRKAKKERPKSVQLYNQIGNFWRIKGDAEKSIECFRRALAVTPHNAEVLLNLAKVLFALQYLDDAIYLTRRSLDVQPPEKAAWQQHFTLGEIFRAYGHYQEASIHFRHSLELRPGYEPAELALKEMEEMPTTSLHIYTLVIIICLVLGVLLVILSSVDSLDQDYEVKQQRHFNKAMAMRSLRFGCRKNFPRK